ncbi:MAG TPA: holo-ACP synthase [Gemmataceae bacterium]|nr:holo-ACP synthase [Gemmataceae bacterium]
MILRRLARFAKIELEENWQTGPTVMEIVGIGTDIVECLRIGRLIEQHGELFLSRVYTAREIRYCQERKRAIEHFAGRWAAKEAILKCLGTGWSKGISWTDVEVRNDFSGQPRVLLCGGAKDVTQTLRIKNILISISHCRAYATAYAMALSTGEAPAVT